MPIELEGLQSALSDRYAIRREVGSGAVAVVYLAEDLKHHRDVAIKVLRPDVSSSLGTPRFFREIDIVAKLAHPHILPLHDSGRVGGYVYYVMPFVAGETLRARLDREGMFPLDDVLRIVREVADALGYAHSHGIIHRDLKPENILLSDGHATVADFGLARAIQQSAGEQLTQTGVVLGSPVYSSPEQLTGGGTVDGRADQYALAVVAYEMLTGVLPFRGPGAQAVLRQKLKERPADLLALRETIPPPLASAVQRAMEKLPADRFVSMEEFAAAVGSSLSVVPRESSELVRGGRKLSFWQELSRRHVYHTAVVYAGASWVLVEVVATTHTYLNLPERAVTILIALAVIGFPVALVLAWIYEITRDGLRRTQAIHQGHIEPD